MAATLTADQELVYASFPISKMEETADGNLLVYGKATDGTVDSDRQVVDVSWSAGALRQWLDTGGNVRVQHNPQRDPAGKGLQLDVTADGHWVKALIVEPVAKDLVRHQVLRAFSVGISRPHIEPDPSGKALGGIIKGGPDTQIVEVSLVDRPANKNCGFQLVAKGDGGGLEFTGKMFGDVSLLTKDGGPGGPGEEEDEPDYDQKPKPGTVPTDPTPDTLTGKDDGTGVRYKSVSLEMPGDVTVGFSPADLAKLHTFSMELGAEEAEFQKVADAEEAFLGKGHRKFNARRRKQLAGSGHALADGSYPIPDADALRRAAVLARSGHGNVAAARRLIARRAKELKVPNPLSENDAVKKDEGVAIPVEDVSKAAVCDMCKGPLTDGKCMKCTGMKSEAELEVDKGLNQMDHDDHDDDSDADEDDKGSDKSADAAAADAEKTDSVKAKKSGGKSGKKAPPWVKPSGEGDSGEDSEDSSSTSSGKAAHPTPADGVTGMSADPVPVHREPDGTAIESFEADAAMPTVPDSGVSGVGKSDAGGDWTEMDAALRLKSAGVAGQLGMLHDLCCPAFTPADVAKAHPNSNFDSIDLMFFAKKAMDSMSYDNLEEAAKATALWTHAQTLKMIGVSGMLALQEEAHKAFRDANPGVSSFPTPGAISAERFRRGDITAGHAAQSPGAEGPHTATIPSPGMSAESYSRGFIQDGHAADSPANKSAGVPARTEWVPTIQENARAAMRAMHDHVAQTFPDVCSLAPGEPSGVMSRPVPVPAGTPGTSAARATGQVHKNETVTETPAAVEPDLGKGVAEPDVEKAAKKLRKKLGKKVLAGKMGLEEARTMLGRKVAQKAGGQTMLAGPAGGGMGGMKAEAEPEALKTASSQPYIHVYGNAPAQPSPGVDADVVKSAVAESLAPLLEQLATHEKTIAAQSAMIEKMADMPDPGVAAFRGMAYKSSGSAGRPGGVQTVAEIAERSQAAMMREMEVTWRTTSDPKEREAAWRSINKMRGFDS